MSQGAIIENSQFHALDSADRWILDGTLFIDLYEEGEYKVALLMEPTPMQKLYKIRLDGFAPKHYQNNKLNDSRRHPFRKFSNGYTGPKQNCHRTHWSVSQERIVNLSSHLQKCIEESTHDHSVFWFNQTIRGLHFLYADFLMTQQFTQQSLFRTAIIYLRLHMDYAKKFFDEFDCEFSKFNIEALLQLEDIEVAFAFSFFEVFETLISLFGGCSRTATFFKQNKFLFKSTTPCLNSKDICTNEDVIKATMISYFVAEGCMDSFLKMIAKIRETTNLIPFAYLKQLLTLLGQMNRHGMIDQDFLDQIFKMIIGNIDKITDKNVKDVTKAVIADTLRKLKGIFSCEKQKLEEIQHKQLQVCTILLFSEKLQHKLAAISYLHEILEKIKSNTSKEYVYIDAHGVYKWALSSGFVKDVLNENNHIEVIKRGTDLITTFCKINVATISVFYIVWSCMETTEDKSIRSMMESTLEQMLKFLDEEEILKQFYHSRLKQIKYQEWTIPHLKLVYTYLKRLGKREEILDLYEYVRSTRDFDSLRRLNNVISDDESNKVYFQELCLNKIALGQEIELHVILLKELLTNQNLASSRREQYIQTVVDSILKHSDDDLLALKLDLLSELCDSNSITLERFNELWVSLKARRQSSIVLYEFMVRNDKGQESVNPALRNIKEAIFSSLLCGMNEVQIKSMSVQEYNVFQVYFKQVNVSAKNMIRLARKYKIMNTDLKGLETLEEIFLNCTHDVVTSQSCSLLCELHMRIVAELEQYKENIQQKLVNKVISKLKDSYDRQNYQTGKKCLYFLSEFSLQIQGRTETRSPQQLSSSVLNLHVQSFQTKEERSIVVNQSYFVNKLKQEVLRAFNKTDCEVTLRHKGILMTNKFTDKPLREIFNNNDRLLASFKQKPVNVVKVCLSTDYYLLVNLLNTPLASVAWNLLGSIPTPAYVIAVEGQSKSIARKLGQMQNTYQFVYLLQIMDQFSNAWWQQFIVQGSMRLIFSRIPAKIQCPLQGRLFTLITKIVCKYFLELSTPSLEEKDVLCKSLLSAYCSFIHYVILKPDNPFRKEQDYEQALTSNIFDIVKKCKQEHHLIKSETIKCIIKYGFLSVGNPHIRKSISDDLHTLILRNQSHMVNEFVVYLFTDILDFVLSDQLCTSSTYFYFLSRVVKSIDSETMGHLIVFIPKLIARILGYFDIAKPEPNSYDPQYIILNTLVLILKELVAKPETRLNEDFTKVFVSVLRSSLFNTQTPHPKCRKQSTRNNVFKLILQLSAPYPTVLKEFLAHIRGLLVNGSWRTAQQTNWQVSSTVAQKQAKYTGIMNLGCICYMNSFIQQLYMIPSFRQEITMAPDPQMRRVKDQENLLLQLKWLFLRLKMTDLIYVDPQTFCQSFKDLDGKGINIKEQMDINQFSSVLFDKLQNQIKGTNSEHLIKEHFGGTFSNQIICKDCPHYSIRQESFLSIPLEVRPTLKESFQTMTGGQNLEGQNAYQCDQCDKKVNSTKRMCLKTLPDHLILVLKRIQFNYATLTKHKINDRCEFPLDLNLKPYSAQQLHKQEGCSKLPARVEEQDFPDEYFEYQLKGVVVQVGSADNGHYYSFIQERESQKRWYSFNDCLVNTYDPEHLGDQTFGDSEGNFRNRERNAYVLIYDRKTKFNKVKNTQEPVCQETKIYDPIHNTVNTIRHIIQMENSRYRVRSLVFRKDLETFCFKQLMQAIRHTNRTTGTDILKFVLDYYLTVYVRKADNDNSINYLKDIQDKILELDLSQWVLELFTQKCLYNQFFLTNQEQDSLRKSLSVFIVENYYHQLENRWRESQLVREQFFKTLIEVLIDKYSLRYQQIDQLFMIAYRIIQRDKLMIKKFNIRELVITLIQNLQEPEDDKDQERIHLDLFGKPQLYLGRQSCHFESNDEPNGLVTSRMYLWATLYQLVSLLPDLHDWQKLRLHDIKLFLLSCQSKGSIDFLTDYLRVLTQSKDATRWIISVFKTSILNKPLGESRPFMILYQKLISINDDLQKYRLDEMTRYLYECLKSMSQSDVYFAEVDVVEQWIIKIVRKSQHLRQFLSNNPLKDNIINLIRHQASVPPNTLKKNNKLTRGSKNGKKRGQYMLHGIEFPTTAKGYRELAIRKLSQLEKLPQFEPEAWDSDGCLINTEVYVNTEICVFIQEDFKFVEGVVKEVSLQSLTILLVGDQEKTMECFKDSDILCQLHECQQTDMVASRDNEEAESNFSAHGDNTN